MDNAQSIEKARMALQQKICKELELVAAEEAKRKENAEQETPEGENMEMESPSNTVVTWLYELFIIVNTFGVRTLH